MMMVRKKVGLGHRIAYQQSRVGVPTVDWSYNGRSEYGCALFVVAVVEIGVKARIVVHFHLAIGLVLFVASVDVRQEFF